MSKLSGKVDISIKMTRVGTYKAREEIQVIEMPNVLKGRSLLIILPGSETQSPPASPWGGGPSSGPSSPSAGPPCWPRGRWTTGS